MYIVLDASSIIGEDFGRSPLFKTLLSASNTVGHTVCVPRLAIAETVAKFSRDFDRDRNLVSRHLGQLSKLLGRAIVSEITELEPTTENTLFENSLVARLEAANVAIRGYPMVDHEDIANKAIARRRPFDVKGSGYRDTLIWLSTLELAGQTDSNLILVAEDGDFGDDNGLHSDLVDDLVLGGYPKGKVTLFKSLSRVIDEQVRPNLEEVIWQNPLGALAPIHRRYECRGVLKG